MNTLDLIVHALSRRAARPLFRPIMRGRATIFMLHRVTDPALEVSGHSLEFVRGALHALRRSGAQFVSVRQIVDACVNGTVPGHDWVAFTVDDGFADQAMMAREVFAAESCPVTIFLISDLIDGKLWPWDDQCSYVLKNTQAGQAEVTLGAERFKLQLQTPGQRAAALERLRDHCKHACDGDFYGWVGELARQLGVALPAPPPPPYRPLTWDQARELESHGVEFGPHSISHRIFSRLGESEARTEIGQSWRRLREELAHPLPVFAWPTGRAQDYTERDVRLAREAGLLACASTDPDYAHLDRMLGSVHGLCSLRRFPLPSRIRDVLQYGSWIERGKQILRKSVPGV